MTKGYPTLEEAQNLLQQAAEYKEKNFGIDADPYIAHQMGVADAARKIALRTSYLNPEKAYILGLLHDYGHRIPEKILNRFHGREGYEAMVEKGYFDVAKICLTHTFPNKNFNPDDMGYPKEWMLWAKDKLQGFEYDDYDRLIQLCDKFYEEGKKSSIEERVCGIVSRYNLSKNQEERLLQEGKILKSYFDNLCNEDVYNILEINK